MHIEYELDGCTATLVTTERTNQPSIWGLLLVVALLGAVGGAVAVFGVYGLLLLGFAGVMLLAGGGEGRRAGGFGTSQLPFSAHDSRREGIAMNWVFARRAVERRLRVKGHTLTFDARDGERSVDLRGAGIRASDVGVFVTPTLGDPIELYWDDADRADAERLAAALSGIRDRDLGDATEVPHALKQARAIQDV